MLCRLVLSCLAALAASVAGAQPMTDAFGFTPEGQAPLAGVEAALGDPLQHHRPAGPAQDVIFHLGEKTLVVARDRGQATALVLDAKGNLAADGLPVRFRVGAVERELPLRGGLATFRFDAPQIAARVHAGASVGGAQSGRSEVEFVPDLTGIDPRLPGALAAAREDYLDVETAPLNDPYGNAIPDGLSAQLAVRHADGAVTLVPSVATGGVLRARMLTRDMPGQGTARLTLGARQSDPAPLTVRPVNLTAAPGLRATRFAGEGTLRLSIGPFETGAGHLLNDGAEVALWLRPGKGAALVDRAWVLNGMAEFTLVESPDTLPALVEVSTAAGRAILSLRAEDIE